MKKEGHELTIVSAISKETSKSIEFVLVSNTDLIGGKLFNSTEDIEDIARRMQKVIHT